MRCTISNYLVFTFLEIIIIYFFLTITIFFPSILLNKYILYFVFMFIIIFFKILRKISFFSPEFALYISYFLFFVLPFYFYQDGILLHDKYINLAMLESFKMFSIMQLISILFFHKFSRKNVLHKYILLKFKKENISLSRLVLLNCLFITIRLVFIIFGYKTNAVSSLGKFSWLDILYIPIFQGSLFLFFISLWLLKITKKYFRILAFQTFLYFILDLIYLSKGRILLDFLIAIFIFYSMEKHVPKKIIIFFLILLFLYIPIAQYVRFKHAGIIGVNILYFLKLVLENIKQIVNLILGRLNMIEPFSRLLFYPSKEILKNYPFDNTIFPLLFITLIPKFIYPDRPSSSIGGLIGYYLGYTNNPSEAEVTVSILGEFYLNFKSKALFILIIYTMYINVLFYFFIRKRKIIFLFLALFFYFFNILTGFESYFVLRTIIFFKLSIVYYIIYIILKKNIRPQYANK